MCQCRFDCRQHLCFKKPFKSLSTASSPVSNLKSFTSRIIFNTAASIMGTLSRSEAYTCPFVPSGVYNDTLPKGCRAHEPVCTAAAEIFRRPNFFAEKPQCLTSFLPQRYKVRRRFRRRLKRWKQNSEYHPLRGRFLFSAHLFLFRYPICKAKIREWYRRSGDKKDIAVFKCLAHKVYSSEHIVLRFNNPVFSVAANGLRKAGGRGVYDKRLNFLPPARAQSLS